MLIVRFEDLLREPEFWLRKICEHIEIEFTLDLLPQPEHKIPFGSRFRDRWYPLDPKRPLGYIEKALPEEIDIIHNICGNQAEKFGYIYPNS